MEICLVDEGEPEVKETTQSPSNPPIYIMKIDHIKLTQHIQTNHLERKNNERTIQQPTRQE